MINSVCTCRYFLGFTDPDDWYGCSGKDNTGKQVDYGASAYDIITLSIYNSMTLSLLVFRTRMKCASTHVRNIWIHIIYNTKGMRMVYPNVSSFGYL